MMHELGATSRTGLLDLYHYITESENEGGRDYGIFKN